MRIVVTGAGGFIGSHLTKALLTAGFEVVGVGRKHGFLSVDIVNHDNFQFYQLDLLQQLDSLELTGCDVVVNLASQQPRRELKWSAYYQGNAELVESLWHKSKAAGVKQFITISSTALYDFSHQIKPISEASMIAPGHFYGLSKYTGEQLIQIHASNGPEQLQTTVLRFPSVFGKNHLGGFVYTYYQLAASNQDIEVFNHGKSLRNALHVSDAVKAILQAIALRTALDNTLTLLVGSDDSVATLEIAGQMVTALQSTSKVTTVSTTLANDGDVRLNLTKMKAQLKFNTMTVKQGITRYVEEMKDEI